MATTKIRERQVKDSDFLSEAEAASTVAPSGASLVGVEDSAGNLVATNVEAALSEIISNVPNITTSTSNPTSVTPKKVGDLHINTSTNSAWVATGTLVGEYEQIDGGVGGGGTNFFSVGFTAATSVTITHGIGVNPKIYVVDSTGQEISGSVSHTTINESVVTFSGGAKTGTAYAIGGAGSANQAGWKESFTATTAWSFTHNLGREGEAQFFDSTGEQFFPTWTQTANAITCNLLNATTGYVIFHAMVTNSNATVTYEALNSNSDIGVSNAQVPEGGRINNLIAVPSGYLSNLGINLTSNVFTIQGSSTALSPTNKAYISMPSVVAGQQVTLEVNSNVSFNDNGHASPSFPTNMGLGITTSVAWANDMPIFLYAVNEDDTSANLGFFFSRSPTLKTTPVAGLIHDFTALGATADSQDHIALMGADDAGKASKPCMLIGSFKMTYTIGATNGYVITALNNSDGIGKFQESNLFDFPVSQNGGALSTDTGQINGSHLEQNGGVAPEFIEFIDYKYGVDLGGYVKIFVQLQRNAGGVDGSGVVASHLTIPYYTNTGVQGYNDTVGYVRGTTGAIGDNSGLQLSYYDYQNRKYVDLNYKTGSSVWTGITNNMFTGLTKIVFSSMFKAF